MKLTKNKEHLMPRKSFANSPCSLARVADFMGDAWALLIVREVFYGVHRFDGFQANLGISRNILTNRLATLCERGILEQRTYQTRPTRHEYHLTSAGKDFFGVISVMVAWGDKWLAGPEGAPVELRDRYSDQVLEPHVVDARTGRPIRYEDTVAVPGPGFPEELTTHPLYLQRFADAESDAEDS